MSSKGVEEQYREPFGSCLWWYFVITDRLIYRARPRRKSMHVNISAVITFWQSLRCMLYLVQWMKKKLAAVKVVRSNVELNENRRLDIVA